MSIIPPVGRSGDAEGGAGVGKAPPHPARPDKSARATFPIKGRDNTALQPGNPSGHGAGEHASRVMFHV
jgi:hypothetical protein